MNHSIITTIALLAFLIFFISSCTDECPEGFACDGEKCICPDFRYQGHGMCRELGENEYYGTLDCIYQDTLFITFLEKNELNYKLRIDNGGSFSTAYILYEEYPEFDSLFVPELSVSNSLIDGREYPTNGVCCMVAHITGRLTEEKFEGRLDWKHLGQGNVIESCPFEMVR